MRHVSQVKPDIWMSAKMTQLDRIDHASVGLALVSQTRLMYHFVVVAAGHTRC